VVISFELYNSSFNFQCDMIIVTYFKPSIFITPVENLKLTDKTDWSTGFSILGPFITCIRYWTWPNFHEDMNQVGNLYPPPPLLSFLSVQSYLLFTLIHRYILRIVLKMQHAHLILYNCSLLIFM
jgi:hypothetical protein